MREAADDTENRSARLNTVCARYLDILAHDVPQFTIGEWRMLSRVLNFHARESSRDAIGLLTAIAIIEQEQQRGEKWLPDTAPAGSLTARVRNLPCGAYWAMAETMERYWDIVADVALEIAIQSADFPRQMRKAGARIAASPAGASS